MPEGPGSLNAAIREAGGEAVVTDEVDRPALDDVKAVQIHSGDLTPLEGLPIEFLSVVSVSLEAETLAALPRLRSLSIDGWSGDLDLTALPELRWLSITDIDRTRAASLRISHDGIRHLTLGRYRSTDLADLAGFANLVSLTLTRAPIESLTGIEAFPELRALDLEQCRRLSHLGGIEAASRLQSVVLTGCTQLDELTGLTPLSDLGAVQVEMPQAPPLEPLVGHTSLEFLWLIRGSRPRDELEALLASPRMRMLNVNRETWMRSGERWTHYANIYALSPAELALRDMLLADLNRLKNP